MIVFTFILIEKVIAVVDERLFFLGGDVGFLCDSGGKGESGFAGTFLGAQSLEDEVEVELGEGQGTLSMRSWLMLLRSSRNSLR